MAELEASSCTYIQQSKHTGTVHNLHVNAHVYYNSHKYLKFLSAKLSVLEGETHVMRHAHNIIS